MFGKKPKEELATLTKKRADLEKRLAALPTDSDDLDAQVRAETERGAIEAMLRAIDARITALGPPIAQEQDAAAMAKRERARQAACDKGDGALRRILDSVRNLQSALGDLGDARGTVIEAGGAPSLYLAPGLAAGIETFMCWVRWQHPQMLGLPPQPTAAELALSEAQLELERAQAYLSDDVVKGLLWEEQGHARALRRVRIMNAQRHLDVLQGKAVCSIEEYVQRIDSIMRTAG